MYYTVAIIPTPLINGYLVEIPQFFPKGRTYGKDLPETCKRATFALQMIVDELLDEEKDFPVPWTKEKVKEQTKYIYAAEYAGADLPETVTYLDISVQPCGRELTEMTCSVTKRTLNRLELISDSYNRVSTAEVLSKLVENSVNSEIQVPEPPKTELSSLMTTEALEKIDEDFENFDNMVSQLDEDELAELQQDLNSDPSQSHDVNHE